MAVIINDLEVIIQSQENPPPEETSAFTQKEQQQNTQLVAPHNLVSILRQQADRSCRVRAH